MNLDSGTISPLGMSYHADMLQDKSRLQFNEEPLAEVTVDMTETKYMPGWLVYNRTTQTFWVVLPFDTDGRMSEVMPAEMALDILSEIYSQEYH